MSKNCDFCQESISEQALECPFCGEENGVPGCTRHFFRRYYLAACPLCEGKPLLRTDRVCPQCSASLHEFSVEWGFNQRQADKANRLARKLESAEKPHGVAWEHLEREGRITVTFDVATDRDWASSFLDLCSKAWFVAPGVAVNIICQRP